MKFQIQANKLACQRTKNRIRENGPRFEFTERSESLICFGGEFGVLVKSLSTDWVGWLPEIEITIINQ